MQTAALPPNAIQYILVGVFALVFIGLRMRRMSRARPLRVEQLWLIPVILAAVTALTMAQMPPSVSDLPWLAVAAVLGAVTGWYRGKTMRITVAPETHALNQAASPAALLFLLVIFALRYSARFALAEESQAWGISLNLLTDAPLVFIVAMFALTRVEMYIRAQRLLREARAAKATATPPQS